MSAWLDAFAGFLDRLLAGLDAGAFLTRYGWVEAHAKTAERLLSPDSLAAMPPEKIYAALDSLRAPGCQVRMTNLGRVNQAAEVVAGVAALLAKPGDFAEKCRAGKIPQAGTVTLSQILCLARPHRFAIRNAPFTRALAKQTPFYTARGLDELGYEEFLDLCRELSRAVENRLEPLGLKEWASRHRFLLLYALLLPGRDGT
ncbi:MAG: hypothetical protein LBV15_04040 [Planctomycetota bacterium]|jgi:hypothetical protein|nr:hypothetical protein [Planctomycetota bacterium]